MNDSSNSNPLYGIKLYKNSNTQAVKDLVELDKIGSASATLLRKITVQPTAIWLDGKYEDVGGYVSTIMESAHDQGSVPIFVLYNIPNRDGSITADGIKRYSSGGLSSEEEYLGWIQSIVDALNQKRVIVVVEPDAVADAYSFSIDAHEARLVLLQKTLKLINSNKNALIYIDAAHGNWVPARDMALMLDKVGLSLVQGFSVNVSNYRTTEESIEYGRVISSYTGGKHFIIDTGRNGRGPTDNNEWCNPPGRALGEPPTFNTLDPLVDAYLWIKPPGESDGELHGGPEAGDWWLEYALGLSERSD